MTGPALAQPRVRARELAVIAVGGGGGAAARYAIARAEPVRTGAFPFTTFAINITGALVLAVLLESLFRSGVDSWWIRPFAAVGVLGGFTTFSSYAFESFALLRDAQFAAAAVNIAGQVVAALAGFWVAYVITN